MLNNFFQPDYLSIDPAVSLNKNEPAHTFAIGFVPCIRSAVAQLSLVHACSYATLMNIKLLDALLNYIFKFKLI